MAGQRKRAADKTEALAASVIVLTLCVHACMHAGPGFTDPPTSVGLASLASYTVRGRRLGLRHLAEARPEVNMPAPGRRIERQEAANEAGHGAGLASQHLDAAGRGSSQQVPA